MSIQEWQFAPFQFSAEQMCFRLSEDPHRMVLAPDGTYQPLWVHYAERMFEHVEMVRAMRDSGLLP